ncbi:hypothetical protein [Umezawaea sp. Da 62-37]|uniref:hypothetical protein n=1 Tax=Umezawaea sp. Da 62-37 TaxID=3075927 RepID=UPI0028F7242E|nr:hypothetical protein [Umezawaea sp. Da 62-37]WNV85955.1 hypothetical protein RM788_48905 [Umezawaea sp. Da 62-37]
MTDIDPKALTDRYVAVWNEPDAALRRAAVHGLWTEHAVHVLLPPQDIRETATGLGFPSAAFEARGHTELEFRVTRAHEEFIAPGTFAFRSRHDADRIRDVVKFRWEMVSPEGERAGAGLEVLLLDPDGRIRADYQFIESTA